MKNSNRNVISKPVLQPIREPYLTTQSVLSVCQKHIPSLFLMQVFSCHFVFRMIKFLLFTISHSLI